MLCSEPSSTAKGKCGEYMIQHLHHSLTSSHYRLVYSQMLWKVLIRRKGSLSPNSYKSAILYDSVFFPSSNPRNFCSFLLTLVRLPSNERCSSSKHVIL